MATGNSLFRFVRNIFGWVTDDREDEPQQQADAADAEVAATGCEIDPTEREGEADECEWRARDEITETFEPEPIVMVESPEDGLPVPADESMDLAVAAPFTLETVVCLEDERQYVELFADELSAAGWYKNEHTDDANFGGWSRAVSRDANERYTLQLYVRHRYDCEGVERAEARVSSPPEAVQRKYGLLVAETKLGLMPVRPARERCRFYQRQCMAASDQPDPTEPGHFLLFRNCTMRRSVGGAFMTLRDEAVYGCDYRDPPDPLTVEKYLDAPDRKRLASAAHLQLVRPFNLADG